MGFAVISPGTWPGWVKARRSVPVFLVPVVTNHHLHLLRVWSFFQTCELPASYCFSVENSITLPAKVHLVKAVVFPVVMYGCEIWTKKKAEHQRIEAFELWCCGRLLRAPWAARRSNQSILKEISPEYSLEGLMLKLRL